MVRVDGESFVLVAQPAHQLSRAIANVSTVLAGMRRAGEGGIFIGLMHWIVAAESNGGLR
jgi:hypothetical protein